MEQSAVGKASMWAQLLMVLALGVDFSSVTRCHILASYRSHSHMTKGNFSGPFPPLHLLILIVWCIDLCRDVPGQVYDSLVQIVKAAV